MKNPSTKIILTTLVSLAFPLLASAALINLVGNDGLGSSSFISGANWSGGAVPGATNDYNTVAFQMRTPGNTTAAYTFAGASLTLGDHSSAGAGNGSLLEKFSSGAGSVRTLTIDNLTNAANAVIRSGGTAGALIHITGNHYAIAGNSSIWADQCIWVIDSPLLGGDSVILTNFANNANDHVAYTANNSGFTGSWYLTGGGTTAWSVELDSVSSLPGNPATFNPGQITFLGTGQLRDTVGCTLNNPNGGITLAANGTINSAAVTIIGEPITDLTNGVPSVSSLTSSGVGTLVLRNVNNTYSGGTIISAGILQLGTDNAIPGNTIAGNVTDNATLDLNGHNATINGLNGAGIVDNTVAGAVTLTLGANGNNGDFTGTIQNSSGTLSLVKLGAGTQTVAGYTYNGNTTVAGGTLNLSTAASVPSTPGNLIVSNNANLSINTSSGTPLPANDLSLATNASLSLTLNPAATGINLAGNLNFQDNANINLAYGAVTANPTAAAINVAGGMAAPGSNVVINITASGLQVGTFTLIKYAGTALASLANFQVSPPPGVAATLVNNTANKSIDLNVTSIPSQLAWNGVNGTSWDLTTANWTNLAAGGITLFRQYTNGSVIAGDAVIFDDNLTNDFVNPQPTNINLAAQFYAFPVVVNSTLPYSIAGAGGIKGVTSLVKSNTGSLTLLTSNSFTGGVFINDSGALIINNDSALGASSGGVTLNGGTLQINGSLTNSRAIAMPTASTIGVGAGATASLGGIISGAGANFNKTDAGTLILTARETLTGNLFLHSGTTIIDSGGSITNATWDDVGQGGTDVATLIMRGTGSLLTTSDFNVGDIDSSTGTLNMSGSATLTVNALFLGSANAAGSTASGTLNLSGGTLIEKSTAVGTFDLGGRNSGNAGNGMGVLNLTNGYISVASGIRVGDYGAGTINQYGGLLEVTNGGTGINLHRQSAGVSGTYNLNGGTLRTEKVTSSQTTGTRLFYFNGGTLQAGNGNLGATPFMNSLSDAYVRNGGAVIDSQGYNLIISQALEHSVVGGDNAVDGGLTKLGTGTLTLSGTNTFTGPITNKAGTLILNAPSTYAGAVVVNAGTLQIGSASTIQGATIVNNNATMTIVQQGNGAASFGNLTLNGAGALPGATLALVPTNTAATLMNCGTLTLNGTNTISLPIQNVGTIALIKYTSAIAGSGNCTNLALPQGATGYISNNVANSTLYAVITSAGPGIVWTGTNSAAGKTNVWDIASTVNWLLGSTPTTYHQVVVPGDLVTFNDGGSGTVLLSNNSSPTSIVISNNSRTYTFGGTGSISGPTGLLKLGSGTNIMSLANNSYAGATVISNGTLQAGVAGAVSASAPLVVGPSGTFEMAGLAQAITELTGAGVVDNNSGLDVVLTVGSDSGGTWSGTVQDQGHGGVALTKRGGGTWVVAGTNNLNNASPFTTTNLFTAGTTVITNGGAIESSRLQTCIGFGGSTATMIVDGGTLSVSNDVLAIGYSTNANGTLIVNNGTVIHGGGPSGAFGAANNLEVGAVGGTGTLIVNGGRVLNSQALWLGVNATGSGTLYLNGGLVQATLVASVNTPAASIAYFNGGTLQAVTNSTDFLQVSSMVMSNGLVLDDNGFSVSISSQSLQSGDAFNGGLIKQGSGVVYLDAGNSYTGTTLVTNGTLAGVGSVSGTLVVAPAGNLGAGDAAGVGSFSINNNLTLQGNAALRIDKTGGSLSQDQVVVSGNVTYGGLLTVTNITSDANVLTTSDTFRLFSVSGSHSSNFTGISGSPGAGLAYSFDPANGVLSVVTFTTASNPTNITASVSGSQLTLSWPSDHTGWILQTQTNGLNAGLSSVWFDVPGSNSGNTNIITINPANPTAFYRLRHP